MNFLENVLLLLGLPAALLLAGSWIAVRMRSLSPAERLATGLLVGLCLLIWNVAALNFFHPISGVLAWLCLWPIAVGVLDRRARTGLKADFVAVIGNRRGAFAVGGTLLFLTVLLAPLLTRSELIYYDGTSNHDGFFWISGAEQLKRHTYMVEPVKSPTQPFLNGVGVLAGWTPLWGRIAGEGLLALLSSVAGVSPLKLYVGATAALFLPWIAVTYLVVRTFFLSRLTTAGIVALTAAQPLFVFFHSNANLPNLLGVITGGLLVVALERSRRQEDQRGWLVVLALALHALLCSYPEVAPFVLASAGLLWLRIAWSPFANDPRSVKERLIPPTLALLGGLALNPVTTIRAWHGFIASFGAARDVENWANLFQPLSLFDYPGALATLTLFARNDFTVVGSALFSLVVVVAFVVALRRAEDRFGALVIFAGAGLLLVYTIITGFNYGWQKTAQFGGVFTAALLPVAAIDHFARQAESSRARFFRVMLGGLALFFAYATGRNCLQGYKWSQRKAITSDWFELREYARTQRFAQPVLVEAPSFRMSFFHGMWAIYFLADSYPIFPLRGLENGGYLRDYIRTEATPGLPPLDTILVSAGWAATIDANSPRLLSGESIALLRQTNRVTAMRGFFPDSGAPDYAGPSPLIEIRPHSRSRLVLELASRYEEDPPPTKWILTTATDGGGPIVTEVTGSPPWRFVVPLEAGRLQQIKLSAVGVDVPPGRFPFVVRTLRVETTP
jgi:hypothetical protein